MAVPAYTTDLNDIYTDTANFTVVGGGRTTDSETDDYIQGSNCWSHDPFSSGIEGGMHNSAQTITANDAVLMWLKCDVVATLATKAAGGMQAIIGSGVTAYDSWYVRGSDDYQAGGWICVAVDPLVTPSTSVGSPTATSWFGAVWNVPSTGAGKGYPMKIDAIRQGRGQVLINGGEGGIEASFSALAAINDASTAKWGLFEAQEGGAAGYRWKGLMSFGPTSLTTFTDSNINIFIENTEYVSSSFNRIEFNNASSIINWTNVSFTALGTVAKGELEMIHDCEFNDTGGVFTDMSTFIYDSNYTGTGRIWRRCGQVTQGGGTFTDCDFDQPSGAVGLVVDDLSLVTGCEFNSDGSGHAVNLGTIASTQSVTWNNTESGYAIQTGTAASRTILVNVSTGITLTINVATGASTPTYYNTGPGTVTVVTGSVSIDVNVKDQSGSPVNGAYVYIDEDLGVVGSITNTTTNSSGDIAQASYSGAATSATLRVRLYGYKAYLATITLLTNSATNVTFITDPQQT